MKILKVVEYLALLLIALSGLTILFTGLNDECQVFVGSLTTALAAVKMEMMI